MNGAAWRVSGPGEGPDRTTRVCYRWRVGGGWEILFAAAKGEWQLVSDDSMTAFITDHAFGHTSCRGRALQYEVEHAARRVLEACEMRADRDLAGFFGEPFGLALVYPCSAFVAEGSPVVVH